LIGTTEFDPQQKVQLRCVVESLIENQGLVKAQVKEGKLSITIDLQLVGKKLDIDGDGIVGKYFLQEMKGQICYESKTLNYKWGNYYFEKKLINIREKGRISREVSRITLQKRSETIVQVPIVCEKDQEEGLTEKCEIGTGIVVANSLSTVKNGYALTRILNADNHKVAIAKRAKVEAGQNTEHAPD
jgi:hypothetical protein